MNPDNKDPFDFADLFKQFSDSINEGIEQAKLAANCEMRRFYRIDQASNKQDAIGVVFPDGTTIVQEYVTGTLHNYGDIDYVKTETHRVQWIDAEKML